MRGQRGSKRRGGSGRDPRGGVAARGRCRRGVPGKLLAAATPSVTSIQRQSLSNYWHSYTFAPRFVIFAFMHVDSLARRFIHSQTHARRFTRAQSPYVLRSIVFVRVVYHANHFGTPHHGSLPHRDHHRKRESQLRYSHLHMVGPLVRRISSARGPWQ